MKRAQEEWKHDIVYDAKRSQGHYNSVTFFMTQNFTVIKKKSEKKLKKINK